LRKILPVPRTLCLLVTKAEDQRDCKGCRGNDQGGN
jgi:hypothetical protein